MDYYDGAGYKVEDMHYFDVYVPSVVEVWESCMKPSIVQIVQYMATFFLWNIAFRLTAQTRESVIAYIYQFELIIQAICISISLIAQWTFHATFSTLHQLFAEWPFHISHWVWMHCIASDSQPLRTYSLSQSHE